MDKPTPPERIEDVIEAISSIRKFIGSVSQDDFLKDIKLQSAVLFQFLIIGEAINKVDRSILDKYTFPWHIPISFRNFIIHGYHGIKLERVFLAVQNLDELDRVMKLILKNEFN